jgi:hypothetical protein
MAPSGTSPQSLGSPGCAWAGVTLSSGKASATNMRTANIDPSFFAIFFTPLVSQNYISMVQTIAGLSGVVYQ